MEALDNPERINEIRGVIERKSALKRFYAEILLQVRRLPGELPAPRPRSGTRLWRRLRA